MSDPTTGMPGVIYSTPSTASVAAMARERYDLGDALECHFINRGFNDTFALRAGDRRFVVRLSVRRARGPADVEAETAFLAYLDAAGVPVAAPVPARDGTLFGSVDAPEGPRPVVVFRAAPGRRPDGDAPEDARAQGITLARVHAAAADYPALEDGIYRLDLDHLLRRPVARILGVEGLSEATRAYLPALEQRLADRVAAIDGMTMTRCHGDCHGGNACIDAGTATLFDFDDGGFGFLAYDLAVHLWAQVSFGRRRHRMWHAFIEGYRSVRAIEAPDFAAVSVFTPIRHLWLLGEYATKIPEWGIDNVPVRLFEGQIQFMRDWERDVLGPSLF
jgi:Ser/Thr protein kinase RdoA (MazF antagonist)